ncbi:MAG: RluA family pseudouridine synthase [Myxococcales bacterium]|nr:RluA family pseudouridine synthase [Myxococcales bacterium]
MGNSEAVALENGSHVVTAALAGRRLDAALRALTGASWGEVRRALASGKVRIAGEGVRDEARAVTAGAVLEIVLAAPHPRKANTPEVPIVYVDGALVVVNKPAGISTVPFGDESRQDAQHTLDALVRAALTRKFGERGRPPLGVVQRLDKDTSGIIVFARSLAAKLHLSQQLRLHTVHRRYLAIARGVVCSQTFRSRLVKDRGDGRRGSTTNPRLGQEAITHVEALEALDGATLIACRLETGRTHQIRIHLAEAGHALVGEDVYARRGEGPLIAAPRQMLHACELGFLHPTTEREVRFEAAPPEDFAAVLARCKPSVAG